MFSEVMVLRALASAAAATAVVGAVVMRHWDTQAGKRVAELTRARAGDEWRYEERVAELETDLEESRELRTKLEQRLRAKRAELAGLRNEHAALLRRYATAETERATALEGRRLLEIEAAVPSSSPALPPARSAEADPEPVEAPEAGADSGDEPAEHAVFSPEGARLYRRALTALAQFGKESSADAVTDATQAATPETSEASASEASEASASEAVDFGGTAPEAAASETGEPKAEVGAVPVSKIVPAGEVDVRKADVVAAGSAAEAEGAAEGGIPDGAGASRSEAGAPAAQEEEAQGQPEAAVGHARAAAASTAPAELTGPVAQPPAGHFTVPTAVAVVPAAPARRPVIEGGFDFFGTQKDAPKAALDSVHNEDLADVVGPEALAVHKAEAEAGFKDAGAQEQGVGQVIDLTAHDETEQIDVQGLRSAAS
ncbi:hypothetical protein BFF78_19090 [Streptomyces fodineus]|uniref:Secreted protein n=1 Tax=Streptomyces fodineus TaxID=1904616 RepID=A0A1D7YNM6_9ACTN|nr:hypothetical protein BFF78_19090 [Streptomyces fodineus]